CYSPVVKRGNGIQEPAQRAIGVQHLGIRKIGVPAARIGKNEDPGALELFFLEAERDRPGGPPRKDYARQGNADERHDSRPPAPDLAAQRAHSGRIFFRPQRVDAGRGPGNQVGDAVAPLRQPDIVFGADRVGDKPRFVQQLPEPVRVSGKVMADGRRSHPGIDANEQDANGRTDTILKHAIRNVEFGIWNSERGSYNAHVNWLFKEEPAHYSYDDLVKDKRTVWSGVKNPLAQKHLHAVRKGDRIFYYHTGDEKAVVGVARALGDAYPDPDDKSGKQAVVDVAPVGKLARAVTLAEI